MIVEALELLGGWAWWVLGLALLAVEVLVPGIFMVWLGLAALIVGVGALFVDWPWQFEVVGFVVLATALAFGGRRWERSRSDTLPPSGINERAQGYLGRVVVLSDAIEHGHGRARVDDTIWRVSGPDLPAGSRVRVTGAKGALLEVEAA